MMMASALLPVSAGAQSVEPRMAESPQDHEGIVVNINGQFVGQCGLPSVSLAPVADYFLVYFGPDHPRRRQFQLEGIDHEWREWGAEAFFTLRFFDANGDQIHQRAFRFLGQSVGWNGSLEKPVFVHRKETVSVPPGGSRFWVVISSAGPPQTLGTILVKDIVISRTYADGKSELLLRAPTGRNPQFPKVPTPAGFRTDGTRASMASLLSITSDSANKPEDCFAIIDSDAQAHAEWRTEAESAPSVSDGDQLLVEWDEAYSLGLGDIQFTRYARPRVGTYQFRVRPLDFLGKPTGPESSLAISIMAPWWQRPWAWASFLAGTILCGFGLSRYLAHQKIRQQFTRMKEERLIEQERLRIARDIHDTLAQGLTGIIVQLQAAEVAKSRGFEEANAIHLHRASELARDSLQEARRSVLALRPLVLEQNELPEALRGLVEKLAAGTHLRTEVAVNGVPRKLSAEIEQNLLRIGLEAFTNSLRHARASRFIANLTYTFDEIRLELIDNGCGFDPESSHEGFGLTGIKERAKAMAGRLSIESEAGRGTTIRLLVADIIDHESAMAT